jgi:membrane-associated phospholipid phosphatase
MAGCNLKKHILSTDIITVGYLLITTLLILIFDGLSFQLSSPMFFRLIAILVIISIVYLNSRFKNRWVDFLHLFYPIILLTYFYGETAWLSEIIFNGSYDAMVKGWDDALFGFQPSVEFSRSFFAKWFSELLNFGYFSYYILTFGVSLMFFVLKPALAEKTVFIIISSFYLYYLIFIAFPVQGPQYYFSSALSQTVDSGIFSRAVGLVQYYGEHPTGAFPSSHVGMVVIFLTLSFRKINWLFFSIIPLFILILFATVYIKAHYAIDVFAGLISAPVVYFVSLKLFEILEVRRRKFKVN